MRTDNTNSNPKYFDLGSNITLVNNVFVIQHSLSTISVTILTQYRLSI